MSNERGAETLRRKPLRFLGKLIPQGQSGAKARPTGVADATTQADIPVPPRSVTTTGVTEKG